ncbi:EAL domain-containing protein [Roseomonas sp. AR75]|uniref:EAL domain-containing protein n=1 Tax=Roseomonas sp. AR75 TaxID=2562311 RepID=UPI0010C1587B|nr:EAL domain-containing protein [Roseomonas sp. AR75]
MLRRPRRSLPDTACLVLVASDPMVIAAAHDAARRLHGARPVQIVTGAEALFRLVGPGEPPRHLVLEGGRAGADLLSAARDRFSGTEVVVVARPGEKAPDGLRAVPAEGAKLAKALSRNGSNGALPAADARSLAAGLARGEITVRFQPIVRLADRRPVMVEALARWERPRVALGAGAFVALAEQAGLASQLALAVARCAIEGLAQARRRMPLRLSFNVPLAVLLQADLPSRLGALIALHGLRPQDVLLELTESTTVRDTALLRRALQRLDGSGFRVLLDDLGLDDARAPLLGLPFAGVKLDRSLISALPTERRARAQVERLVRRSHAEGRAVVAEGVTDPLLWRAAAAAGCDLAQGFGVGRPIPPDALPAWIAAWSGAALPDGR